jgi:hypothetical protein
MFRLPGRSYRGPLPRLTSDEIDLRNRLLQHVHTLAADIGERNVLRPSALKRASDYIETTFKSYGYLPAPQSYEIVPAFPPSQRYSPPSQSYDEVSPGLARCPRTTADGSAPALTVRNIEAEIRGFSDEILIIGAHYDTVPGCPGANDNASGIAAILEIARLFVSRTFGRTVRFVAFVNEEPPFFTTDTMGSSVYARRSRARGENIVGMFSLETIGYYSQERRSQQYPGGIFQIFFPDTGDFLAFVSNIASRRLLRSAGRHFRSTTKFPSEGAAAPADIPGVSWSDHWSFWQQGYPAVMLTDTAPYRYPHYHLPTDTPDKLDYDSFARVVMGLSRMFAELAGHTSPGSGSRF